MTFETRDGQGALFANTQRSSDRAPNAKGRAKIGGAEYWISAWTRTTGDGRRWQSLAFEPVEPAEAPRRQDRTPSTRAQQKASDAFQAPADFDDEIPF